MDHHQPATRNRSSPRPRDRDRDHDRDHHQRERERDFERDPYRDRERDRDRQRDRDEKPSPPLKTKRSPSPDGSAPPGVSYRRDHQQHEQAQRLSDSPPPPRIYNNSAGTGQQRDFASNQAHHQLPHQHQHHTPQHLQPLPPPRDLHAQHYHHHPQQHPNTHTSAMPHRVDPTASHRRPAPYEYYPHPHRRHSPPPIATLPQSPSVSTSSLDRSAVPSPARTPPQPASHPAYATHAHQQQQHAGNGRPYARLPYELTPSYPVQAAYGGGAGVMYSQASVAYTDDAATKLSDRVRRRCFNCCTTDTSTWRRSNLHPGKVLCNKCGLFERTHSRPRPDQFPHRRGPLSTSALRSPPSIQAHPAHLNHNHTSPHLSNLTTPAQVQAGGGGANGTTLPPMQSLPPYTYHHPSIAPLSAGQQQQQQAQSQGNGNGGVNGSGEGRRLPAMSAGWEGKEKE